MTTRAERERLIIDTVARLTPEFHGYSEIRGPLGRLSPETLHRINKTSMTKWQAETLVIGLCRKWEDDFVHDYLHAKDALEPVSEHGLIEAHLSALKHYDGMCPQTRVDYPEERAFQVNAIITVLLHLQNMGYEMRRSIKDMNAWKSLPFLYNPGLQSLVMDSRRRDATVKIIIERGVVDSDVIVAMIGNTPPALMEGIL